MNKLLSFFVKILSMKEELFSLNETDDNGLLRDESKKKNSPIAPVPF